MHDEGQGPAIGDWQVAEAISEWIEIIAIAVITIAVVVAFVNGARTLRPLGVKKSVERSSDPWAAVCCSASTC